MCGFISWLSVLFHWSTYLFLCQFHTVLITVALQYSLKTGSIIPPALFFLKIVLVIQGLLCFHTNFRNNYFSCVKKMPLVFWYRLHWICRLSWLVWSFYNINSSNPWTQHTFPSVWIAFNFFHKCLIVFQVQVFYLLR